MKEIGCKHDDTMRAHGRAITRQGVHIAAKFAGTSPAITGLVIRPIQRTKNLRAEERMLQQKLEDASKRQGLVKYQDTCAASEEVLIE